MDHVCILIVLFINIITSSSSGKLSNNRRNKQDATSVDLPSSVGFSKQSLSRLIRASSNQDSQQDVKSYKFDEHQQVLVTDTINRIRSNVVPKASNMRRMNWDSDLADVALHFSEQCLFEHNSKRSTSRFSFVGENIYIASVGAFDESYIQRAIGSWEKEHSNYVYNETSCKPNALCGHYTQIVWSSTFMVGCGASQCSSIDVQGTIMKNVVLLVCNFGPGGNLQMTQPYKAGIPCSACENPNDTCSENLCVNPERTNFPITASWLNWGPWEACTKTCGGGGYRLRERLCSTYVTDDCTGYSLQADFYCADAICSLSKTSKHVPTWLSWEPWSQCSETCGIGRRSRGRVCSSGIVHDCAGNESMTETCKEKSCTTGWSTWKPWSKCSKSCGGGKRTRERTCLSHWCPSQSSIWGYCNMQICPNSGWGDWKPWSQCDRSCGAGRKYRTRECLTSHCPHDQFGSIIYGYCNRGLCKA